MESLCGRGGVFSKPENTLQRPRATQPGRWACTVCRRGAHAHGPTGGRLRPHRLCSCPLSHGEHVNPKVHGPREGSSRTPPGVIHAPAELGLRLRHFPPKPGRLCEPEPRQGATTSPTCPGVGWSWAPPCENSHAGSSAKTTDRRATADPRQNSAPSWHCSRGAATAHPTAPAAGETQTPRAKGCAVGYARCGALDTGKAGLGHGQTQTQSRG